MELAELEALLQVVQNKLREHSELAAFHTQETTMRQGEVRVLRHLIEQLKGTPDA
jgi:hypothetical protein